MKTTKKSLKSSMKRLIVTLFKGSVIGILLVSIGFFAGSWTNVDSQTIVFREQEPVNEVLEYFLDELEQCESGGNPTLIVENDGGSGRNSRGSFMFQFRTAKYYMKKYDMLDGIEDEDIINLIHNRTFSRQLAKKIITTEKKGWAEWFNCSKKIGLDNYKITGR